MALTATTFVLIVWGGEVTSQDAGMSVPDAPTTYEHNLFMFPPSQWVGGIFWEHTHRLLGSFVGLLAIIMCWALLLTQKGRNWLRWMGVVLLAAVIAQGLMGIWRVTLNNDYWAIAHGVFGQIVLCLAVLVTAALGRIWLQQPSTVRKADLPAVRRAKRAAVFLLVAVFVQLTLGATTRHTDAGLAIPDFPTNFGGVIPPFTQDGIDEAMARTVPYDHPAAVKPYTPTDVMHHFSHRVWALVVCGAALLFAARVVKVADGRAALTAPTLMLILLLVVQIALGASVIWSERTPWLATSHQAVGAVLLALATLLVIRTRILPLHESTDQLGDVSPAMEIAGA